MLMSVMITGLRSTEHKLNLHRSAKVIKATEQAEIQKGIDNTAEKTSTICGKGLHRQHIYTHHRRSHPIEVLRLLESNRRGIRKVRVWVQWFQHTKGS